MELNHYSPYMPSWCGCRQLHPFSFNIQCYDYLLSQVLLRVESLSRGSDQTDCGPQQMASHLLVLTLAMHDTSPPLIIFTVLCLIIENETALLYARFEVITALLIMVPIFWDVMFLVLQFLMLQTIMTPSC